MKMPLFLFFKKMAWRRDKIALAFGPTGLDAIPNVLRQNQAAYWGLSKTQSLF